MRTFLAILAIIGGALAIAFIATAYGIKWVCGMPVTFTVTTDVKTEKRTYRWFTLLRVVEK